MQQHRNEQADADCVSHESDAHARIPSQIYWTSWLRTIDGRPEHNHSGGDLLSGGGRVLTFTRFNRDLPVALTE